METVVVELIKSAPVAGAIVFALLTMNNRFLSSMEKRDKDYLEAIDRIRTSIDSNAAVIERCKFVQEMRTSAEK